ncbi:MAG: taurine catabolism dioxygenase TauD [Rhodospirillaceae bacterium]|nr:taurine catabolism dioxygenase TauD [Rhodospirillaceae bacterium]HAA94050.1 TauD/TfdA family dioxygenase [Rhodospirillaceae bacterium]|tara:strand:+ start:88 stop:951 length:864 start_codon:yes stop_codon:yes gene_type:complete
MSVAIQRIGESFVAEVDNIDLAQPIDDTAWEKIYRAYLDHQVLVFRGQSLTPQQYCDFAARFGPLEPHAVVAFHHPENPAITVLSNRIHKGKPKGIRDAGSHWHSDYTYKQVTSNATLLYALEVPDAGGDTWFGDTAAAYSALPEAVKARLEGLEARQQYRWLKDRTHPESRWVLCSEAERQATPEVVHPVVRTHPETGRKGIFVFPGVTGTIKSIVGLDQPETDDLLQMLFEHCQQPQFLYRFKWQDGDLVVYDNRTLMHCATTNKLPANHHRTLYRINTTGSEPY